MKRRSPAIGTRSFNTGRTPPSSKSSATCRPKRPTACAFSCLGNIEFPYEVDQCQKRGADGIGLYRTEFLFLSRDDEPTEEEQTAAYTAVATALHGQAGRDADDRPRRRQAARRSRSPKTKRNPFLGLRSIRLALKNPEMFRKQLRAILRASVTGNISIMFPLVSTMLELKHAKMVLRDARKIWKKKARRSIATSKSA